MEKQRLFVDMDGTLAVFQQLDKLETLYEKGYFLKLEPIINVVQEVQEIIKNHPEIEIYILSACLTDSDYAIDEKNQWLNQYLPEINQDHRIFPPCGTDKKMYIPGGVRSNDFLLDDYTQNLCLWQPPARGIKLLNGINHTHETWEFDQLRYDKPPVELADNIISIMHGTHIIDVKPQKGPIENKDELVNLKYWEKRGRQWELFEIRGKIIDVYNNNEDTTIVKIQNEIGKEIFIDSKCLLKEKEVEYINNFLLDVEEEEPEQ